MTTDALERVYDHRDSQELHFNKREQHAEPTRNLYRHPSSQEKLVFPQTKPATRPLADNEAKADRMYDSPAWREAQARTRAAEGIRPAAAPTPPEVAKPPAVDPAKPAAALPDAAPAEYATTFSDFDAAIAEATKAGNTDHAALLAGAKAEAAKVLAEYGVSGPDAQAFASILNEYVTPLDDAALEQKQADTMTYLRWMWGDQAEAKIAAARRVAQEASARLPWLRDALNAGAGNDARVIQKFVTAARTKGFL